VSQGQHMPCPLGKTFHTSHRYLLAGEIPKTRDGKIRPTTHSDKMCLV
jgi:hypothetical protein